MARLKLNKVELTRLRRDVKTYNQYLPVLKLKQEQLQAEQLKARRELARLTAGLQAAREALKSVIPLLAEPLLFDISALLTPLKVTVEQRMVAGVDVPVLAELTFPDLNLSYFGNPIWFTKYISKLREFTYLDLETRSYTERLARITAELRRTSQKVNLFELVLVPQAKEGIRRIRIALGDQQVAAVGRAKIAKSKAVAAARRRVA